MAPQSLLFVYNPHSGKKEIHQYLSTIINTFTKASFLVTVYPTQKRQDGYHFLLKNGSRYHAVVCAGGDGTLNEVINAFMRLENRPLLGYIPSGSTNDFAASVNIPVQIPKAAELITKRQCKYLEIGKLNHRYFSYVAAFGIFTDVSYDTNQSLKNMFGHAAYVMEGIKRLGNIKAVTCKITCNGSEEIEGSFIFGMITNSASIGGFRIGNSASHKRKFQLILLRQMPTIFDYAGTIATLTGAAPPGSQFIIRDIDYMNIESTEPIAWTLDGEYGGEYNRVKLNILPNVIQMYL